MKYANAADLYPPDLVRELQRKHSGLLWVPSAREFYRERDERVRALRRQGRTVREIAQAVYLSERSVYRILRG